MKLAIVGTGMIVREVLPVLHTIDGIELAAIVSSPRSVAVAQELGQVYGIEQMSDDYAAVLASSRVDTVYVALPNHLHYQYAKNALLAGKNVICEKPFTLRAAELNELAEIAQERSLFLLEAITNQHLPNFRVLQENLALLGDIKIVTCNYSQYSSRYDAFQCGEIAPAFDPAQGGGALRDLNIYNIHLIIGLLGQPESVQYLANVERGVDTSGVLIMDYAKHKAVCIGSKDSTAPIQSTIQGNKGSLTVTGPTNALPEITLQLNGQAPQTFDLNGGRHRMTDEFIAFEQIVSTQDFVRGQQLLEHSQLVMKVLEQAGENL